MGELSLVKRGGSGPKVQVLTATSYSTPLTVTGVTITPTRILVSITTSKNNGYIDTYVKSGTLDYYTVEYGSARSLMGTVSLSNGTLTLTTGGAGSYQWYGGYQIVLIED